jgi:hypothetical protein
VSHIYRRNQRSVCRQEVQCAYYGSKRRRSRSRFGRLLLKPFNHHVSALVDLYDGESGPTLRIEIGSAESVVQLCSLFRLLSGTEVREIKLSEIHGVQLSPRLKDVILLRLLDDREPRKLVEVQEEKTALVVVTCRRYEEGWLELADQIVALSLPGQVQYLTGKDVDDAEIEVLLKSAMSSLG